LLLAEAVEGLVGVGLPLLLDVVGGFALYGGAGDGVGCFGEDLLVGDGVGESDGAGLGVDGGFEARGG